MGEVTSMAVYANDAKYADVETTLRNAIDDVRSGALQPNKVLVIFLNDKDGVYDTNFAQCDMKCSEMLSLLDVFRFRVLNMMGIR